MSTGTVLDAPGYRRPEPGTQPPYAFPSYRSSLRRAPSKPLILLPHSLSEVTGGAFWMRTVARFLTRCWKSGKPTLEDATGTGWTSPILRSIRILMGTGG